MSHPSHTGEASRRPKASPLLFLRRDYPERFLQTSLHFYLCVGIKYFVGSQRLLDLVVFEDEDYSLSDKNISSNTIHVASIAIE